MTEKRGGRENQSSRSHSLGGLDPRMRRQPQSATTDQDLQAPLKLYPNGRIGLDLTGALQVDSLGRLILRVTNGLKVAPGSPVSLQLDIEDDSMEITSDGRVRARPRASQVRIDQNSSFVGNKTLKEALDSEIELLQRKGAANGYCDLDSTAMVPAARIPFDAMPLDIYVFGIKETTYDQYVHVFRENLTGPGANWAATTNSASGDPIKFSAEGADTDIGIEITTKGAGVFTVNGNTVQYELSKDIPNGYAGLDGIGKLDPATLPLFDSVTDGAVPASTGTTTDFLRADGSWAAPGGGGGGGLSQANALAIASFGSF